MNWFEACADAPAASVRLAGSQVVTAPLAVAVVVEVAAVVLGVLVVGGAVVVLAGALVVLVVRGAVA